MANYTTSLDEPPEKKLVVVNIQELLLRKLPPREEILSPWLLDHSSNMIFAWRGVGKTHVALGIAYAVASGGAFLKWKASKPRKVLYVDGEMPTIVIQDRLAKLATNSCDDLDPEFLKIITPDLQFIPLPNLGTHQGQEIIDEHITKDTELIIIDNLSSLVRSGRKENEAESWDDFEQWLLRLRSNGKCILIIHHAGKNGSQRGTSKREDLMDTVIQLKKPSESKESKGANFEVHFDKSRSIFGLETVPFLATLKDQGNFQTWEINGIEVKNNRDREILLLRENGLNQSEIAEQLSVNKSTVCRSLKKQAV